VLSSWVVATDRRHVAWRTLLRDLVPKMAIGMPLGFVLVRVLPERATLRAFGVFVIGLALREIAARMKPPTSPPPSRPRVRGALLVLAGVLHGAFGVGGPLAVYVASRDFEDKSTFRSTLSALWLILNVALVTTFALRGTLDRETLRTIAVLLPATAIGIALGSVFHRAVPERLFGRLVLAMLIVMGVFRIAAS
jgi:uncharacterized membrane protein YfcA